VDSRLKRRRFPNAWKAWAEAVGAGLAAPDWFSLNTQSSAFETHRLQIQIRSSWCHWTIFPAPQFRPCFTESWWVRTVSWPWSFRLNSSETTETHAAISRRTPSSFHLTTVATKSSKDPAARGQRDKLYLSRHVNPHHCDLKARDPHHLADPYDQDRPAKQAKAAAEIRPWT